LKLLSIIIPVFNEEKIINKTIEHVRALSKNIDLEIIVSDGEENFNTLCNVEDEDVIKIKSRRGRGIQMNTGVKASTGKYLLFLHADTILPEKGIEKIVNLLTRDTDYGAFDLKIGNRKYLIFRIYEKIISIRSRLTKIPYGDQAIFIKKTVFNSIKGFRDFPIMEDIDLMNRLKKSREKFKIRFIKDQVTTSARKWEKDGIIYTTLRNWYILFLYNTLSVSPKKLVKYYYKK